MRLTLPAILLLLACSPAAETPSPAPPPKKPFPVAVDKSRYVMEPGPYGPQTTIRTTFTAPAGKPVYLTNCNGAWSMGVQRLVDGQWVHGWTVEMNACLSPPILIPAGGRHNGTMTVLSRPHRPVPGGIYRAAWHGLYTSFDRNARPWGEELPLEQRVSDRFAIEGPAPAIIVHAAASLADALTEIGAAYEKQTGAVVRFNFGASSALARQITTGAPGDVFFSADEAQMDRAWIAPETRRSFLSNALVIVVPADRTAPLDLATARRIAIAEPSSVPAGVYARQWLQQTGLWPRLQSKLIPTENARATLAAVESGNVDAGFVYATDARISKKVKVAQRLTGIEISYPVAVLRDAPSPDDARLFVDHLASPAARQVFAKHGFSLLPAPGGEGAGGGSGAP